MGIFLSMTILCPLYSSYQTLCGVIDGMADLSTYLCQTLGLPVREWVNPYKVVIVPTRQSVKRLTEPANPRSRSQSPGEKPHLNIKEHGFMLMWGGKK